MCGSAGSLYQIYLSQALSSWGERLWMFAAGLYLAMLYSGSFEYTAIYGFATCVAVIIGGPYIGTWVDRSSRLKAATYAIIAQNLAVSICATLIIVLIQHGDAIRQAWNGSLEKILFSGVILFGSIGELASVAAKIAISKDWIVVLAGGDESKLSKMNSIMRTIDLTTYILAPAIVAEIIAFVSPCAGAAFIAGWNVVSGALEIYLLHQVFKAFPQLAHKEGLQMAELSVTKGSKEIRSLDANQNEGPCMIPFPIPGQKEQQEFKMDTTYVKQSSAQKLVEEGNKLGAFCWYERWYLGMFESLEGWADYFEQRVRWAGVGLALLYMTVLGFDSITITYIYSQGISVSILGVISAVGALSGILGSLLFPILRKKLGKCGVGNFGFGFETCCLILCVVSVFLPGSAFPKSSNATEFKPLNGTEFSTTIPASSKQVQHPESYCTAHTSAIFFIFGVVLSRFGLWIADLSVTQLFQEEVPESQRGIINGVQDSMNQILSLVKFILVMMYPNPATFGYLIIASWTFVFLGWLSFVAFTWVWRRSMQKKIPDHS